MARVGRLLAWLLGRAPERAHGAAQERELVVRWLLHQARSQPAKKASCYDAAADAIKAGHHQEPDLGCDCGAPVGKPHSVDCPVVDHRWEGSNG
jgi:hypothetical protein